MTDKVICVGSRKSELALIQTKHVIASLQKLFPELKFEIHTMTTMGDRVLNISLPKIGEKALFTKDLEDALISGRVDFVVHSLKDLPTALPAGMAIGAILEREDPRDALVLRKEFIGKTLATLSEGSIIGTSSLRRGAQLARKYPHLKVHDIRGNLNTRLAKLDAENSKFAGIILAQAGLVRMGWKDRINQTLNSDDILYAVGQGALAVECRSNDTSILAMLQKLSCLHTQCKILTERSFLKTLGGGCSAPVAVVTNLKRKHRDETYELNIIGAVWSLDGTTEVQSMSVCALNLDRSAKDNDADEAVTPPKKIKLNLVEKPVSPTIVDDSKVLPQASGSGTQYDIEALINIHGELFKKCPYAMHHQAAKDGDRCPLNTPIGQEVMGECPYVDAEHKVLQMPAESLAHPASKDKCPLSTVIGKDVMGECPNFNAEQKAAQMPLVKPHQPDKASVAKCPFTGALRTANTTEIEPNGNIIGDGNNDSISKFNAVQKAPHMLMENGHQPDKASVAKCPFTGALRTANTMEIEPKGNTIGDGDNDTNSISKLSDGQSTSIGKCPFLQAGANQEVAPAPPETNDSCNDVPLYCGLYRHQCYRLELFEKCEQLGRTLAKELIANGAMAVMEKAQEEIRQKS